MINRQQLHDIVQQLKKQDVQLIAVSKTKPATAIEMMYELGQRAFGENRVQELVEKHEQLPKDIDWHMIGHLQTNKVKYIAPFIHYIHAVDSLRLLTEINKQAAKQDRVINCLLQVHIADEATKFGFLASELKELLHNDLFLHYKHVKICGLMGMATYTTNTTQITKEFASLQTLFQTLKTTIFADKPYFKELSMGMSGDYNLAIAQGSTMVRIGSLLFGSR